MKKYLNYINQMIRKKELYRDERFWTLIIAFLVFLTCLWLTYTERFIKEEYSYTEDEVQTIHLNNGETLYQEVLLNGNIKALKLGIETMSEQKESALNIHLVQGGGITKIKGLIILEEVKKRFGFP